MKKTWPDFASIRRDYGELSLNASTISTDPMEQFQQWFDEVLEEEMSDPTAMVLSTVDEQGHPDSRVVLLKGVYAESFVFYTNYDSRKGRQMMHFPYAALNFYWPQMARQVRVRGKVSPLSAEESDSYFSSRPHLSQLSAIASPQSQPIKSRETLEQKINELIAEYGQKPVIRPRHWGGFKLEANEIEFWQGRDNRLHDRFQFVLEDVTWRFERLAP